MRDRFWAYLLAEHRIDRDRVETWTPERPRRLQALRRSPFSPACYASSLRKTRSG
jgi:hypothetical protein